MARLFIGIPLPEEYHDRGAALIRDLKDRVRSRVSWTPFGNAHVTLLFLGDTPEDDIPRIRECLQTVSLSTFQARAGICGAFPDDKRPRVIHVGITKGAKYCADLAQAVTVAMAPLGIEPSPRPFHAHITLGRVKQLARDDWPKILKDAAVQWPGFKVDRFTLWRSDLTQEGPVYTPIAEFALPDQ